MLHSSFCFRGLGTEWNFYWFTLKTTDKSIKWIYAFPLLFFDKIAIMSSLRVRPYIMLYTYGDGTVPATIGPIWLTDLGDISFRNASQKWLLSKWYTFHLLRSRNEKQYCWNVKCKINSNLSLVDPTTKGRNLKRLKKECWWPSALALVHPHPFFGHIFSFRQSLGYFSPRKGTFALYFWKAKIKFGPLNHSAFWVFM